MSACKPGHQSAAGTIVPGQSEADHLPSSSQQGVVVCLSESESKEGRLCRAVALSSAKDPHRASSVEGQRLPLNDTETERDPITVSEPCSKVDMIEHNSLVDGLLVSQENERLDAISRVEAEERAQKSQKRNFQVIVP